MAVSTNTGSFRPRTVKSSIDGTVSDEVIYLSSDDEMDYNIAQANEVVDGVLAHDEVVVRYKGDHIKVLKIKSNSLTFLRNRSFPLRQPVSRSWKTMMPPVL